MNLSPNRATRKVGRDTRIRELAIRAIGRDHGSRTVGVPQVPTPAGDAPIRPLRGPRRVSAYGPPDARPAEPNALAFARCDFGPITTNQTSPSPRLDRTSVTGSGSCRDAERAPWSGSGNQRAHTGR